MDQLQQNNNVEIDTEDIDVAVAALRSEPPSCFRLRGVRAGWGDAEATQIANAIGEGGGAILHGSGSRTTPFCGAGLL